MVLELPLFLANTCGLLIFVPHRSKWYFLLTLANFLNLGNFVFSIGFYMLYNIHNLDSFTNSFGAFSSMVVSLLKTSMFLQSNRLLGCTVHKLRALVKEAAGNDQFVFQVANRLTNTYTKKLFVIVYFSVIGVSLSPLLAMVLEYVESGRVIITRWELPFKEEYFFFDVSQSPYFEIVYFISAIGMPLCSNCSLAIDTIFMGLCLYVVALLRDLKANLDLVDDGPYAEEDFKQNMSQIILYHNKILQLIADIKQIFGRMFFTQFVGTIFILCAQSTLVAMVSGREVDDSKITFTNFFTSLEHG